MDDIFEIVERNDQAEFDLLLNAYFHHPTNFPSLYYVFEDFYLRKFIPRRRDILNVSQHHKQWEQEQIEHDTHRKQLLQRLVCMMETWMVTQSIELKEYIAFSNHQGWRFYIDFLRFANNPVQMIAQINAGGYLCISPDNDNDDDEDTRGNSVEHLTRMLECNLDDCVGAIVSQQSVQQALSQQVEHLDLFFNHLLQAHHTPCAIEFLQHMRKHFSPHWVGLLLNAVLRHNNHTVAQWLHDCAEFSEFLQWSDFTNAHLPQIEFGDYELCHILRFEPHFPTLFQPMMQNLMATSVGNHSEHALQWVAYAQDHLSSPQRIESVRCALHTRFVRYNELYMYGTQPEAWDELVQWGGELLNVLTPFDVAQWKRQGWRWDGVYRVMQHPRFI